MTLSSVSAAVLMGGRSRRMGAPKALLRLVDDGPTLIERIAATLRGLTEDVLLVGAPSWPLPAPLNGYRLVTDRGVSAADGIVAALEAATHRFCIVVACDMPFLHAALLREMATTAMDGRRGVVATAGGNRHPLHAVWDRERLREVRAAVTCGERSLVALTLLADMAAVDLDAPGRDPRERWSAFNVNTPDDLAVARAHAREDG